MKKIITILILCGMAKIGFAAGGWATSAVALSVNGGSAYNYKLNDEGWTDGNWGSNTLFGAYNFGTPTSLVLNGGSGNGWTDDTPGYTAASFKLYYRVYLTSGSGGSWSSIALDYLAYSSGPNKIYDKTNVNIDVMGLVSNAPGTYYLEVVMSKDQFYSGGNWNSMVPGGQATAYNSSNDGYKATFTIAALPVELTTFTAKASKNSVLLTWQTSTEVNNYGFEIERMSVETRLASSKTWNKIGFIQGNNNSNSQKTYTFTDDNPPSGKVQYRLKQIDNDGSFKYTDFVEVYINMPQITELHQNYPNPFNPTTSIKFNLNKDTRVKITVYDILGNVVNELVNENKPAGSHIVYWNSNDSKGNKVTSGIYFYRLVAGEINQIKKMTMLK